jgi:uncharacterized protein (TIGR02147 family)
LSKPYLYDYFDYREYLNDTFAYLKKIDSSYSHRKFLADADIPGSTYLLRVLRSERKLSPKYIENFCKALHLNTAESAFFAILVKFGNEKNVDKKETSLKELLKIRSDKANHSLDDKKLRYFEKWYYPVLRDLIGLVGKIDYNALGRMLIPPIKGDQVQSAIEYLHRNGFITPRETGDGFVVSEPILSTPPSVNSTILSQFHKKNLELDIEAFDNCTLDDRSISSVIMSVSMPTFEKMRIEIQEFRKRLIALAREDTNPDMVCRVGIQMVPRAKVKKKDV